MILLWGEKITVRLKTLLRWDSKYVERVENCIMRVGSLWETRRLGVLSHMHEFPVYSFFFYDDLIVKVRNKILTICTARVFLAFFFFARIRV